MPTESKGVEVELEQYIAKPADEKVYVPWKLGEPIYLAVCMPIYGELHVSVFRAVMELDTSMCDGVALETIRMSPIEKARNQVIGRLLTDPDLERVTHVLWIDDDAVFPRDALARLIAWDKPIVGALAFGRRPPSYAPILLMKNKDASEQFGATYRYMHDYPRGLVEVDATGSHFILVRREVYEAIEKKWPRPEEGGPYTLCANGEDVSFCERAKQCGYSIFVDTTLEAGHLGEVIVDSAFAKRNRLMEFNPWVPEGARVVNGKPLATVVIPTYNTRPEWLKAAVKSALEQTVPVEVIVVDDGSTKPVKLEDIRLGDTPNESDERLRIIRHETNQHLWAALNTGIKAMTTDWFCWLSSDDLYYPYKVERQLRATVALSAKASYHAYDILLPNGEPPKQSFMPVPWRNMDEQISILRRGCCINGLTAMVHRSVFEDVGVFDTSYFVASDHELWLRIAKKYFWLPIPELFATRRESGENASTRYAQDPEKRAVWLADDKRIKATYAPRCKECGALQED